MGIRPNDIGQTILYNSRSYFITHLNPASRQIWLALTGTTNVREYDLDAVNKNFNFMDDTRHASWEKEEEERKQREEEERKRQEEEERKRIIAERNLAEGRLLFERYKKKQKRI
jgi:hypothetical protein